MSNTDRHRPYWVQIADPEEKNRSYNRWTGDDDPVLLHKTCGCYMCSKYAFQVPGARVSRLQSRRAVRRYLRGADSWD